MRLLLLAVLCLACLVAVTATPSQAVTRHVPLQYPTIQTGINACVSGDTVLVSPGTYTGPDNRNLDFQGVDLVLRSKTGPEETIIDCNDLGRGLYFHSQEGGAATVDGFTITNGIGVYAEMGGGGILVDDSYCTVVVDAPNGVHRAAPFRLQHCQHPVQTGCHVDEPCLLVETTQVVPPGGHLLFSAEQPHSGAHLPQSLLVL